MAIDLFASARSTALITLVAASFTSPIVIKSDAVAHAGDRIAQLRAGAEAPPATERVVAGGIAFDKPAAWGVLGASAARGTGDVKSASSRLGTVVSALCPGGSAGSTCKDDVRVTFVAYSGGADRSLPVLTNFRRQLDERLVKEFRNVKPGSVQQRAAADGSRYLDYAFTYGAKQARRTQRIAAFRHANGSGVVMLATGRTLAAHDAAITKLLSSAHEPVADEL